MGRLGDILTRCPSDSDLRGRTFGFGGYVGAETRDGLPITHVVSGANGAGVPSGVIVPFWRRAGGVKLASRACVATSTARGCAGARGLPTGRTKPDRTAWA